MYDYMYLCTNEDKNKIKITIRLMIPILRTCILRLSMLTNFTQNWMEPCNYDITKPSKELKAYASVGETMIGCDK